MRLPVLAALLTVAAPAAAQQRLAREPVVPAKYALGPDSRPQAGVPKGKLNGPFLHKGAAIPNTVRRYWVYVPAQYAATTPACLLVFQDGARAVNPAGQLRVPQVLDNLIAKRQIPVTVGLFVTPGERGDTYPESVGTGNPNNRDREYDVLTRDYGTMILDELIPELAKTYRLADDAASRAIGGTSSGAICAFTVAWERPDRFRNVVSMIGSYTDIHGGHVYPDLVRAAERKPIRVFLQDGELDNRSPENPKRDWYSQNRRMIAALGERQYDFASVIGKGGHSDDHGGAMLPLMLRWVWRDHPAVAKSADDLVALAAAIRPEPLNPFPGFDAKAAPDRAGTYTWQGRGRAGAAAPAYTLTLTFADGKLAGTLETKAGGGATTVSIADAAVAGNKVLFAATARVRDQVVPVTYQGVVTARGIAGWQLADAGGQPRDAEWSAKRAAK